MSVCVGRDTKVASVQDMHQACPAAWHLAFVEQALLGDLWKRAQTVEEMLSLYGWDAVEPVGRNWTILPKWYTHRWKAYHAPELAKKMGRAIEDAPASWQAAGIQSLPLPERGIKSSEEGKGGTGGKDTKAGTHTHGSKNTKGSKSKNKGDKGGKGKGKNGANSFQSTF